MPVPSWLGFLVIFQLRRLRLFITTLDPCPTILEAKVLAHYTTVQESGSFRVYKVQDEKPPGWQ